MASRGESPASSDLSEPPSIESEPEDRLTTPARTPAPSSRHARDTDTDNLAPPPPKRRKTKATGAGAGTGPGSHFDKATPQPPLHPEPDDDTLSISSDGFSSAPGSPSHDEWSLREEAQTACLWRDCPFGQALNNDDLVEHVQATHCASGGPKKTKYVCEWGECQRKTSHHPSGYALKAHMRSHTKEKPYYCALPECDKAFTRSDALAKHMRTVHEPEQPRGGAAGAPDPTPPGKKGSLKVKMTNGTGGKGGGRPSTTPSEVPGAGLPPIQDEDGNEVPASAANDNITYIPAHHPITGQPGFMIHYPPDIQFTAWESSIAADQLMRLLRRQLHWAQHEQDQLKRECDALEQKRREEWTLKEILLEGALEAELARGEAEGFLEHVDERVTAAMEHDVQPAKHLAWTPTPPSWRRDRFRRHHSQDPDPDPDPDPGLPHTTSLSDMPHDAPLPSQSTISRAHTHAEVGTPDQSHGLEQTTPSPPPTGHSAGFDGTGDPYDNYLEDRMAGFERLKAERDKARSLSLHGTPRQPPPQPAADQRTNSGAAEGAERRAEAEADAVGALLGMSGGDSAAASAG
ncbi:hypothetical protein B0A50_03029 [Salinomyces thailandicus]|uniref:C2H2-type domain-containing protein n=1 Tax=Salinomyces thailandicus TaxID=706561 RepID=A0A4U0U1A4_9PEZI|nr:hypothetical protein B0A50_03029 [Salinomyces thailandica]